MNYSNIVNFLEAYPQSRELQFVQQVPENRYRSFQVNVKHILSFPEESGVGTMILQSMTDINKIYQLEYYIELAKQLKIENVQGFYESITYTSCRKGEFGKINLSMTSVKWLDKMLSFVVNHYSELKYGNGTKRPRRNSKQFKDVFCRVPQTYKVLKPEHKNFKDAFDLISNVYMTIIKDPRVSLSKPEKKFVLSQIESCLIKIKEMEGV